MPAPGTATTLLEHVQLHKKICVTLFGPERDVCMLLLHCGLAVVYLHA